MPSKFGTVPTYSTLSGYSVCAPSSASAVKALAPSPCRNSRLVPNRVMRVRGSAGLKFPSELRAKGSLRIDTDSSTIARVDDEETLKTDGVRPGDADAAARAPHAIEITLAPRKQERGLRKARALIFIQKSL